MSLDRRTFLLRSAAVGAGVAGATGLGGTAGADDMTAATPGLDARIPFDGPHQAGVVTPPPAHATFAALDAVAPDATTLVESLRALSERARVLSQGTVSLPSPDPDDPPADSGTLGPRIEPDRLTVTIGFGASLFDDRYGLAKRKPARLTTMAAFGNDDLDPARTHGDVLLQICANQRDTVVHTLRELMRPIRAAFALRWTIDGFASAARHPNPAGSRRNLFGFRDGTGNPDPTDAALMDRLVWVGAGAGEPDWTVGGTYLALRTIRMHVEFWDRVGLREQENMIGRRRNSGAPLGGAREHEDPRYELDPHGDRIPLDAHIRLANPRTPATADQRLLRRGYSYHRGFDEAGQLDQGLLFAAFNQDPERQFAAIQARLDAEPMVDYITPVGGGYFFLPPGARGAGDWVGSGAFAA